MIQIKFVTMDLKRELTQDEQSIVKVFCDDIDEYLTKFKQSQELQEVANSDALRVFERILNLVEGVVKSAITRYLASREEIFDMFELCWDILVQRSISSLPDIDDLLSLNECIINLTDCSDEICLAFGQKGLLHVLTEYFKISNHDERLASFALTVIYNCCWRVPENRVICREHIDILQECSQSKNPEIQADAFLALSYIVDKSEAHKISLNEPCLKFLLSSLKSAISAPDRRCPGYLYSALEVLEGINQLAINDSNKVLLVKLGGIDVLEQILVEEESNNDERLWAARGIWQLAFKEENKIKIHQRTTLLDALKKIKETTENCDVLDACSGALFVINDVSDIDDVVKGRIPPREGLGHISIKSEGSSGLVEGHIMISYQHASQEMMLQVKCYLEECGYNIWLDVDKMKGDILDAMAKAVQEASVVLVCMTRKFKESQHCRTEATYAYTLNKYIIPLMLEDQFAPEDWLGALMGMKKYYPMFSDDLMRQSLPDLVKELGDRGKRGLVIPLLDEVTDTSSPTAHGERQNDGAAEDDVDCSGGVKYDEPTNKEDRENFYSQKVIDVDTWDEEEAGEWLRSHGVDTKNDNFKKVNGTRLKQIKNLLNLAPEFCLKSLKDEVGLDIWDVLSLVDALKKL